MTVRVVFKVHPGSSCFRAFLKKNFRYSMGAPWAGAQGASEAAVFSILPELATQRDGPRRPGESEILFERCSKRRIGGELIREGSRV